MMMDNEKLNTALYEKMSAEQGKFRDWLLTQPPEEILEHAYEYTVREDLVMVMENVTLGSSQASVLLASPSPLADLFHDYEKLETGYMDTIRDCMESRADALLKARRELPVYPYPATYARENGELEAYRASHKANIACRDAIEIAIRDNYRDNCLSKEAAKQVVDEFGYDRTFYVLAATIREMDWDGRFSSANKQWAKTIPVFENLDAWRVNRNCEFVVNSHPGLTDIFVNMVRRAHLLTLPLTKEDIQAEAHKILSQFQNAREPNSPEGTHFMAQVSPDFLARASSKDQGRLMKELPFPSLSLSTLKDRRGVFAFISQDEDRFHPPRRGRASVRDKLQAAPAAPKPPKPGKKKEMEL